MKQRKQQPPLQQTVEPATGNAGAGGSQPQQQMTKEQMRELHKKKAAAAAASGGNAGNDNAGAPPVKDVKVDLETQAKGQSLLRSLCGLICDSIICELYLVSFFHQVVTYLFS